MIALPIADFLLGLVNMRSFYIHDAETTAGFKFTTASVVVDLLLLTITIHEERHLPLRLKDETVCIHKLSCIKEGDGLHDECRVVLSLLRIVHHFIPGSCSVISTH